MHKYVRSKMNERLIRNIVLSLRLWGVIVYTISLLYNCHNPCITVINLEIKDVFNDKLASYPI